jgi:hypothetical protein
MRWAWQARESFCHSFFVLVVSVMQWERLRQVVLDIEPKTRNLAATKIKSLISDKTSVIRSPRVGLALRYSRHSTHDCTAWTDRCADDASSFGRPRAGG